MSLSHDSLLVTPTYTYSKSKLIKYLAWRWRV